MMFGDEKENENTHQNKIHVYYCRKSVNPQKLVHIYYHLKHQQCDLNTHTHIEIGTKLTTQTKRNKLKEKQKLKY